jgi:putative solute:sodium symporter small subunit
MSDEKPAQTGDRAAVYWRENVKLLCILLAVWFAVSFGAGVLFVDMLNEIRIGGFKLGFWFAQQGSIIVFVILIFVYAARMRALEKRLGVSDE